MLDHSLRQSLAGGTQISSSENQLRIFSEEAESVYRFEEDKVFQTEPYPLEFKVQHPSFKIDSLNLEWKLSVSCGDSARNIGMIYLLPFRAKAGQPHSPNE